MRAAAYPAARYRANRLAPGARMRRASSSIPRRERGRGESASRRRKKVLPIRRVFLRPLGQRRRSRSGTTAVRHRFVIGREIKRSCSASCRLRHSGERGFCVRNIACGARRHWVSDSPARHSKASICTPAIAKQRRTLFVPRWERSRWPKRKSEHHPVCGCALRMTLPRRCCCEGSKGSVRPLASLVYETFGC